MPYENAAHAPALAIESAAISSMLTRTEAGFAAPTEAERGAFAREHDALLGVLASWTAAVRDDLPQLNAELVKRKLPALTIKI